MNTSITQDKVKLFEAAGCDTKAYDYAIPQQWADTMRGFGIEDVCSFFAADCSRILPVLRHTGQAWAIILDKRAKANHDIVMEIVSVHGAKHPFILFLMEHREIYDEIEAGLCDVNHIMEAFNSRDEKHGQV
jgi:hypothetical protein